MSEREEHNELIHQLAERLRNHTVPYKEGAWERFRAAHGRPRRKLWPYWSAAAVLLATLGSYWIIRHSNETLMPPQIVQQDAEPSSVVPSEHESDIYESDILDGADTEVVVDQPVLPANNRGRERQQRPDAEERLLAGSVAEVREEVAVEDTGSARGIMEQTAPPAVVAVDTSSTLNVEPHRLAVAIEPEGLEQLVNDTRSATDARTSPKPSSAIGKWDLGLVVSPSLTSEAINMGGGVAVAYRISDRFAIGSGISVAQLGVGENPNHQPQYDALPNSPSVSDYFNGRAESALNYRREVSLTSSVVTLDVPLDLRFDVAKGFYTSVGVSYVAILNEQRTSHVVDQINKNTFASGNSSITERLTSTEFVYSSEKIPAKPLRGNGYAGFMNFSLGKRLPISGKLFLSVEPYFKLPIGRLSKEEMDFTNGGIRIVTGF